MSKLCCNLTDNKLNAKVQSSFQPRFAHWLSKIPDYPLALHHVTREMEQNTHSASLALDWAPSFGLSITSRIFVQEQVCVWASVFFAPINSNVCRHVWDVGTWPVQLASNTIILFKNVITLQNSTGLVKGGWLHQQKPHVLVHSK